MVEDLRDGVAGPDHVPEVVPADRGEGVLGSRADPPCAIRRRIFNWARRLEPPAAKHAAPANPRWAFRPCIINWIRLVDPLTAEHKARATA